MGDAASIRSRKKEGLPAWEESSSPSSSSRAAGGLSSISSATHASAGAIDRLIQPAAAAAAATRERERETEKTTQGRGGGRGALERSRLSGVRCQAGSAGGLAPVQSKSESAITGKQFSASSGY